MAGNNSSVFGMTARRGMRCAIYTRKSTEEGLEQEFNTLDAQRDSAEAYIRSQREDGWVALPDRYDDGGYTTFFVRKRANGEWAGTDDGAVDLHVLT